MEYTFKQIDEITYELRVSEIIFLFDTTDAQHAQIISDFADKKKQERFAVLLVSDPNTAYEKYCSS